MTPLRQRGNRIAATGLILLAAGGSTRLGQPKQLLPFAGRTLLRHAAETAVDSGCAPLIAVLGADADRMRQEFDGLPAFTLLENPDWRDGMASSLRCGIAALTTSADPVEAVVVLLCDQPFVTPSLLQTLVAARAGGDFAAAVSVYESGASGPPCIFARRLFPDLLALRGAEGARQVLRGLPKEAVVRVAFPEGDQDVDTVGDWERVLRGT